MYIDIFQIRNELFNDFALVYFLHRSLVILLDQLT